MTCPIERTPSTTRASRPRAHAPPARSDRCKCATVGTCPRACHRDRRPATPGFDGRRQVPGLTCSGPRRADAAGPRRPLYRRRRGEEAAELGDRQRPAEDRRYVTQAQPPAGRGTPMTCREHGLQGAHPREADPGQVQCQFAAAQGEHRCHRRLQLLGRREIDRPPELQRGAPFRSDRHGDGEVVALAARRRHAGSSGGARPIAKPRHSASIPSSRGELTPSRCHWRGRRTTPQCGYLYSHDDHTADPRGID